MLNQRLVGRAPNDVGEWRALGYFPVVGDAQTGIIGAVMTKRLLTRVVRATVLSLGLFIYLVYALLRPERF